MKNLNEKFQSLVNGSTHSADGVVGTNHYERKQIVDEVFNTLPNEIKLTVNNVALSAVKNTSLSGKSTSFFGSLTKEQFLSIVPSAPTKKKGGAYVMIHPTGMVEVNNGGNFYVVIENKNVTILN